MGAWERMLRHLRRDRRVVEDHLQKEPDTAFIELRPERAIEGSAQDALGRKRFAERLANAVVNRATGRATGVVIGITGPWGSGKSSILTMLAEELQAPSTRARYHNPIVVRFDPWLVSGRDDVISQFFTELAARIREETQTPTLTAAQRERLLGEVAGYGAKLMPLAALKIGPLAKVAEETLKAAKSYLQLGESLTKLREKLRQALWSVNVPIIVLIDELDRIEDAEIRSVAQLVRAVADFPGISYVLAYDVARVAEALGSGTGDGRMSSGRGYLEKIVQIQIPIPLALREELRELLRVEFSNLHSLGFGPTTWEADERLWHLVDTAIPDLLSTPRDIQRLAGHIHVLEGAVRGEVDWVDLVAYSMLLVKAPETVSSIRRNPERVVEDPIDAQEWSARINARIDGDRGRTAPLDFQQVQVEAGSEVRKLLSYLFPRFSAPEDRQRRDINADALRYRRPLLTLLHLGLIPGAVSRAELESFVALRMEDVQAQLELRLRDGRLGPLIDRMHESYPDIRTNNAFETWRGIARFIEPPANEWLLAYTGEAERIRAFEKVAIGRMEKDPKFSETLKQLCHEWIAGGFINIATDVIRAHFFLHGMYGRTARGATGQVISPVDIENLAVASSEAMLALHRERRLLQRLRSANAMFLLMNVGAWTEECRMLMDAEIMASPQAVVALSLLFFGGSYIVEKADGAQIVNVDAFCERVRFIVETKPFEISQSADHAMRRILEEWA